MRMPDITFSRLTTSVAKLGTNSAAFVVVKDRVSEFPGFSHAQAEQSQYHRVERA